MRTCSYFKFCLTEKHIHVLWYIIWDHTLYYVSSIHVRGRTTLVKYNTYLKRSLQLPRSPRDLQLKQRLTTAFDGDARAASNSVVATAVCHLLPLPLLLPPPLLMVRWRRGSERAAASTCFHFSPLNPTPMCT